jgi:hypothetical protein
VLDPVLLIPVKLTVLRVDDPTAVIPPDTVKFPPTAVPVLTVNVPLITVAPEIPAVPLTSNAYDGLDRLIPTRCESPEICKIVFGLPFL